MKNIAIVIAFVGFRDEEFFVPFKIFKEHGLAVDVFSSEIGIATGKLGASQQVNKTINNLHPTKFDAVVFVGGPGGYSYLGDHLVQNIISQTFENDKLIAAICMAPLLLGDAGILQGKKATVFPGDVDKLISFGAEYTGGGVEVDGNIITADGPASAEAFALAIIGKIKN